MLMGRRVHGKMRDSNRVHIDVKSRGMQPHTKQAYPLLQLNRTVRRGKVRRAIASAIH
jgi:hypothetical protein